MVKFANSGLIALDFDSTEVDVYRKHLCTDAFPMTSLKKMTINPDYLKPEFSSKFYRATYNYLKARSLEKIFEKACSEVGIPIEYLLNDNNWLSAKFNKDFADIIVRETADSDIFFKVGEDFLNSENITLLEYELLRVLSPFQLLSSLGEHAQKVNIYCSYKVDRLALGKYRLRVVGTKGPIVIHIAKNTAGILKAVGNLFRLKNFKVHLKTQGDYEMNYFEVDVEFQALSYILKKAVLLLFSAMATCGLYLMATNNAHLSVKDCVFIFVLWLLGLGVYFFWKLRYLFFVLTHSSLENDRNIKDKHWNLYHNSETLTELHRMNQQNIELLETMSHAAHDIRSPLSALNFISHSLKEDSSEKKILLTKVTEQINSIATELLQRSKGSQQIKSSPLTNIHQELQNIILEKSLGLQKEIQIHLHTDADKKNVLSDIPASEFNRIISNIINNSLDALKQDGHIFISTSVHEGMIHLTIEDNGKGIPAHLMEKVGQRGFSYDKQGLTSGSGLGLYSAMKTLKDFGGQLKIESAEGKGTKVHISLPLIKPAKI